MEKINFKNLRGELSYDHNLARYTSWRVGGNAQRFYRPADLKDLQNFLTQLPVDEPLTWLGLGSNVLIRDGGILGTVVLTLNRLNEIDTVSPEIIRAEAGVTCAKLAKFCVKAGFENGAFFAGIPGTVGGALAMNAGAFGGETWRQVQRVETMDRQGKIFQRTADEFKIQYRQVDGLNGQYFIAGYFRFNRGDAVQAKEAIQQLLKKRNETQPIGTHSCGSVFRNPPGDFAARLIDAAGLKGTRIGDAEVSQKHANFILNHGKATATDVENLIYLVRDRVQEIHGVELTKEVHIIGNPL
jgi:UDP-N-acetylmuramate dehydrogenase